MEAIRRRPRAVFALLAVLVLASIAAFVAGRSSGSRSASGATVTVDLRGVRQVMQGFGSSVRLWSDPHLSESPKTVVPEKVQGEILTALYGRLGLTRSRQVLDPGIQRERGGAFNFAAKLGEDQVAFVKQAKPYGLRLFFPGPAYIEEWMKPDDPGGYVDYAMRILEYWRSKGAEPPAYAPMNEPALAGDFPPRWMHDVVLQLGRRLEAQGFETKLVIPDDENPVAAYKRAAAVLEDPAARKYVAAVAFHIYRGGESDWPKLRQLASRYGLPLWMTEIYDPAWGSWPGALGWARTVHGLITVGGVNAVDYIWGFFGDWVKPGGTMIALQFDGGIYKGLTYTPVYWVTGQWSRFVRPGYRRVDARGSTDSLLVSAYTGEGRVVVVAINTERDPQKLSLRVAGGRVRGPVSAVRTSASEQWRPLPPEQLRNGRLGATLAPQSVTTFSFRRTG